MMTTIFSGLSDGSLYALVGMLLTIPLVRCGDFNFALPMFIVLGEYVLVDLLGKGWALIPAAVVLCALGAVMGGLQEVLLARPTRKRDSEMVAMVGLFVAIQGFVIAYYGINPESVSFFGGTAPVHLLGGVLAPIDLWLIGLMVVSAVGLHYAVRHTRWGVLGRASMTDEVAAKLRGVNVPRMRTVAYVVAGALSCGFAVFVAPKTGVSTNNALHLILFGFAAMAVGGFGSFTGAAAGGLIIGFVETFSARYLTVDWAELFVFGTLCAVLVIRPQGLFGPRGLRLV
jgi:branched-chain amino acid transport system permease protein